MKREGSIRHAVAVVSGKGGVGKSLVTALLAVMMRRRGYRVGVLDADVTGPTIPRVFGADECKLQASEAGMVPVRTHSDIRLMSIGFLLDRPDTPVIWRGPLLANAVKQFHTEVEWGDLDLLLLDMPPGTGDVPLTVFQSIRLDGILVVTSPQELVSQIVRKAFHMAEAMGIPVLGLVENMSHVLCPDCGRRIDLFGESRTEGVARELGIPLLDSMPVDPALTALCDEGAIERVFPDRLDGCVTFLADRFGPPAADGEGNLEEDRPERRE